MPNLEYLGWPDFIREMRKMWNLFIEKGENVFEDNFDEKFKNLFYESKGEEHFEKLVREFWEQNYRFVANSFSDLEKAFKKSKTSFFLYLLPETEESCDQAFSITMQLYEHIAKILNERNLKEIMLINCEKEIFIVKFDDFNLTGSYRNLIISQINDNQIQII